MIDIDQFISARARSQEEANRVEETFAVLTARHKAERDRYGRMLGIGVPEEDGGGPPPEAA
jgi:hypothetical protein